MESNTKNKWQVRVAVMVIFVIGFAAGILATNIYRMRQASSSTEGMRSRFEQIVAKLNLTPEQKTQVNVIFDDARAQLTQIRKESEPKFHDVRKQADERLKAVLTPEQWEQFQKMMGELKQRRHGRDRGNSKP